MTKELANGRLRQIEVLQARIEATDKRLDETEEIANGSLEQIELLEVELASHRERLRVIEQMKIWCFLRSDGLIQVAPNVPLQCR